MEYGTLAFAESVFSSFHSAVLSKPCPSAALIQPQVLYIEFHCGERCREQFFFHLVKPANWLPARFLEANIEWPEM